MYLFIGMLYPFMQLTYLILLKMQFPVSCIDKPMLRIDCLATIGVCVFCASALVGALFIFQEETIMSGIIKELYYGNIEPQEINSEFTAEVKEKLGILSQKQEELMAKLNKDEKELFLECENAYNELSGVCNADSFATGFRLGARFAYDVFVKGDKGKISNE